MLLLKHDSPMCIHFPIFDLPSILILTSWGMKEGLGNVKGGSPSGFSTLRPSGADHLLLRPVGLLPDSDSVTGGALQMSLSPNLSSPFSLLPWPPPPPWSPHCPSPFSCSVCRTPPRTPLESALGDLRGGPREGASKTCPWLFLMEPFLRFFSVREMQTSPTESLVHGNSSSWVVCSGQHDDQPWPNTKKGYSTSTSTLTCERKRKAKREDIKYIQ